MLLAYLSKPFILIGILLLIVAEAAGLVYSLVSWRQCANRLAASEAVVIKLTDDKHKLSLVVQKQTAEVKLLQAQGDAYKGQLAVAIRSSEELKKLTERRLKSLRNQQVSDNPEAIRQYLLEGRGD